MSTKKLLKEIQDKSERVALQKLIELYNLQDFNVEVANGHVKTLAIKFKNLQSVPALTDSLPELENLDLSRNQIGKIEGLTKLVKLKNLCLRENKLTKISNLETLVDLKELDLSDNNIDKIEGLFNLRNLLTLDLSRNRIRTIQGLDYCKNLRTLKLNDNPIDALQGLDLLTRLETLLITHAQIQKIEGLNQLVKLVRLNLAFNQITKIEGLSSLQKLQFLYLNDNQISTCENLEDLILLQELVLVHNPFNPSDLEYIAKPTKEILQYCRFKSERHQKDEAFKRDVKQKRDKYQIDQEIAADTIVQSAKETKKVREKLIKNAPIDQESVQIAAEIAADQKKFEEKHTDKRKKRQKVAPITASSHAPLEEQLAMPEKEESPPPANLRKNAPFFMGYATIPTVGKPSIEKETPLEELNEHLESIIHLKEIPNPSIETPILESVAVPVPNPQIEKVNGQNFATEQEWLENADQLLEQEDIRNALKAYRNVLQLNTRNFHAWIKSGIAFNNKEDYARATGAFKQALAIDSQTPDPWLYLGIAYFNLSDFEEAAKAFNETLKLDFDNGLAKQYLDQIPPEYRQNMDFLEKQAEIMAQTTAKVEDRLLERIQRIMKAYEEITFTELLPLVTDPPNITDIPLLKQKLTDLILEGRLRAKLFIDHIQFLQNETETNIDLEKHKVDIEQQYNVLKLIAFTNFSKLWLVEDPDTHQQSVLKMILFKGELVKAKLAEQMALREIALTSRISSPNVISLLNAFQGEYHGETGYVLQMPYYANGTLDKRIKELRASFDRQGVLISPKACIGIFIGLLQAIIAVHEAGIVHRDIKPANIVVNTERPNPSPEDIILIDFGIATAPREVSGMDFTIAGSGNGVGSFGFSAPEQLQNASVDYSADIFAIGATIYYSITLNRYPGQFFLPDYVNERFQEISEIFPILQKMLADNPADRYQTTEELRNIKEILIDLWDKIN